MGQLITCKCGHEIHTQKTDKIQCGKCYTVIQLENYFDKRRRK